MNLYDVCSARLCNVCLLQQTEKIQTDQTVTANLLYTENIFLCECKLVVYCGVEHQKMDRLMHKDLCRAAIKIMQRYNVSHPFFVNGLILNKSCLEDAIISVKFLMRCILYRQLHGYEEELTSYPAYCAICYSVQNWKPCTGCYAVAYCSEDHAKYHAPNHRAKCATLKLYYCPYKVAQPKGFNVINFEGTVCQLEGTDLLEWFNKNSSGVLLANPTASLKDFEAFSFIADFSCMTTLCNTLRYTDIKGSMKSEFNVFIVGATIEQKLWFREVHTKLFFACYPQVLKLTLYFIGPEVKSESLKRSLLYHFKGKVRKVMYETFVGTFESFMNEYKIEPTVIVGFNCGFSNYSPITTDMKKMASKPKRDNIDVVALQAEIGDHRPPKPDIWRGCVSAILLTYNVPFIYTSFTLVEAESDYAYLLHVAHKDENGIYLEELFPISPNSFRDLRPLRSFQYNDHEEIFYRNGYIHAVVAIVK